MLMLTFGKSATKRLHACGSSDWENTGRQAIDNCPWSNWRRAAAVLTMRSRPKYARCTSSNNCSAWAVGRSRPRSRSNRVRPVKCSRRASSRLTVGCEVCSMAAAAVTLPVVMMARKTSIWRKEIVMVIS